MSQAIRKRGAVIARDGWTVIITSLGRKMADLSGFEPRLCAVAYIYYIYHSSYFAVTSSLSPFNHKTRQAALATTVRQI